LLKTASNKTIKIRKIIELRIVSGEIKGKRSKPKGRAAKLKSRKLEKGKKEEESLAFKRAKIRTKIEAILWKIAIE